MAKVLVADDNADIRELCLRFLEIKNHHPIAAASKDEVYDLFYSFTPDIILMDVMFGTSDGRELCRDLKQKRGDIKVILISAREDLLEHFKSYLADFAYTKPFSIKTVCDKIEELTKVKSAHSVSSDNLSDSPQSS